MTGSHEEEAMTDANREHRAHDDDAGELGSRVVPGRDVAGQGQADDEREGDQASSAEVTEDMEHEDREQ